MSVPTITPFDRIEAAQEYLRFLSETVADNRRCTDADILEVAKQNSPRCLEVLKLVSYNLEKLDNHLKTSRQALNNLRKLRQLLLNEGTASPSCQHKISERFAIEAANGGQALGPPVSSPVKPTFKSAGLG
jgi:hypothetical protein